MIRTRTAEVITAERRRTGITHLEVSLDGALLPAIAYEHLTGTPRPGDVVCCNTTAVELGLGTGGALLVIAIEGRELMHGSDGHAMKLRYSPHQLAVQAVEETHPDAFIDHSPVRVPLVIVPLHSLLAPLAIAADAVAPGGRLVFVMTDQAALAVAFSDLVPRLRDLGLLHEVITTGQSFGGDREAVTVASGIIAAARICEADLIVVGMGPGNLGTGTRYGFAALEVASSILLAKAVGADPVVAARLSFADRRARHQGLSHHLRTALEIAPPGWRLALPSLPPDLVPAPVEGGPNIMIDTTQVEEALWDRRGLLASMGRGFEQDPWFFRAGAASALLALGGS